MKSKKWRFGAVLMAVAILTGAIAGVSYASDDRANPPNVEAMCQNFVSKLATNLGMDESAVTTALDTTKRQMIDEAVQKGSITQEQADKISARPGCFCGGFGFFSGNRGPGGPGGPGVLKGYGNNLDDIANALDMTVDELKAEMDSGKRMNEIVTGRDMTVEQFQEKMHGFRKAKISQAVEDGKLTQEQANKMLENLTQCPKGPDLKERARGGNRL